MHNQIDVCHYVLFVADQAASTAFYRGVLDAAPALDVPGMTEFHLGGNCILGLMPISGAKRLLGRAVGDQESESDGARSELYLLVDDAAAYHARAIANGAKELSPLLPRDWGHAAAYSLDPDGHVLAFATVSQR